jgi:autotransporter-associated beta strand protein
VPENQGFHPDDPIWGCEAIARTAGLFKNGTGRLTLTGANTYSGGTTVTAGALQLSGSGTLGATTAMTTVKTGGTLDLGTTTQTQAAVSLAGGTLQNGSLNAPISSTGGTINEHWWQCEPRRNIRHHSRQRHQHLYRTAPP